MAARGFDFGLCFPTLIEKTIVRYTKEILEAKVSDLYGKVVYISKYGGVYLRNIFFFERLENLFY